MIIVDQQNGDLPVVLCDQTCLEGYFDFVHDPSVKRLPLPKDMPTFGCYWCGTDLVKLSGVKMEKIT